jgi:hypothetical protein
MNIEYLNMVNIKNHNKMKNDKMIKINIVYPQLYQLASAYLHLENQC